MKKGDKSLPVCDVNQKVGCRLFDQHCCCIIVDEEEPGWVTLQESCRNHWILWHGDCLVDSFCLDVVWNDRNDVFCLHDFLRKHGDCLLRNVVDSSEPAFSHLLLSASFIKVDNLVGIGVFKVCWWVIEGNVTIFTNTDDTDIDGVFSKFFSQLSQLALSFSLMKE